jgi:hypothetical protein
MNQNLLILTLITLLAACGQSRQKQPASTPTGADSLNIVNTDKNFENADCHDEFIETNGKYSLTKLGLACYDGNLEAVKKFISEGACKEQRCMTDDYFEFDLLYTAIYFEHPHIVEYSRSNSK